MWHHIEFRYGSLSIRVWPFGLSTSGLVELGITHYATFSNYEKLIDECGPGMEKVKEMHERRIADMVDPDEIKRTYGKTVAPVIQESMIRCLEKRPALVPKECKRRMIVISSKIMREVYGTVGLQCGESSDLPLEIKMAKLDAADPLRQSWRGPRFEIGQLDEEQLREEPTHIGHYSNLDKLLDECGPGAKKARDIAIQTNNLMGTTFDRIIADALIECLKKRNLVPSECLDGMVPTLFPITAGIYVSQVGFRCGGGLLGRHSPQLSHGSSMISLASSSLRLACKGNWHQGIPVRKPSCEEE